MALRLLGTGTTDANGCVVLADGYTGTGAGCVDIVAEAVIDESSVVSNTYEVWDTIYNALNGQLGNETSSSQTSITPTITTTDTQTEVSCVFTSTGSQLNHWYYSDVIDSSSDFEITFKLQRVASTPSAGIFVGLYAQTNQTNRKRAQVPEGFNEMEFKLQFINGVVTIQYREIGGSSWIDLEVYSNGTIYSYVFGVHLGTSNSMTKGYILKDVKAYKI